MMRNGSSGDLTNASTVIRRNLSIAQQAHCPARWFDLDPTPVFVLQSDGVLVASNESGRQVLETGAAVTLRATQLAFADDEAHSCFKGALEKVTSGVETEIAVVLRCDDGRWRRLELSRDGDLPVRSVFVTFRGDPKRNVDIGPIIEAFRLSFSEGNVLLQVARGLPPKRIATKLKVSPHTVRAHLRSLYVKMHVHGMQELIREYTRLTA